MPPLSTVMMGIITACVGGILRDVLAGVPVLVASVIGAAGGFGLRAMSNYTGTVDPGISGMNP